MSDAVKGAEARTIDEFGDGEVFDYDLEHEYMVVGSSSANDGRCAYGGRPRDLDEARLLRDAVMNDSKETSRYDIFEIVSCRRFIRYRVVETVSGPRR